MNIREYPQRPIIGTGVCILCGNRILLARRKKMPRIGSWSLPGGAQKIEETIEECAIREIREETGFKIAILGYIDTVDSITYDNTGKVLYHYTLVDFFAKVVSGELRSGSDASEVKWFSKDQVETLEMWNETKRIISLSFKLRDNL